MTITWRILRFDRPSVTLPPLTHIMTLLWGSGDGAVPLSPSESAQGVWLIQNPPTWKLSLSLPESNAGGRRLCSVAAELKNSQPDSWEQCHPNFSSEIYLILLFKTIMCDSEGRNIRESWRGCQGDPESFRLSLKLEDIPNYHSTANFAQGNPSIFILRER